MSTLLSDLCCAEKPFGASTTKATVSSRVPSTPETDSADALDSSCGAGEPKLGHGIPEKNESTERTKSQIRRD